jgi:hypothetical protein
MRINRESNAADAVSEARPADAAIITTGWNSPADLALIDMTPVAAPFGWRDKRLDQRPLIIRQVAGIANLLRS